MNIYKTLCYSALFKSKNENEIEDILSTISFKIKDFHKSDVILSVNQITNYVGIILSGNIEIQKNFASGKIVTISIRERGEVFGEGSVFSKTNTYPCNIIAKTKSKILLISKSDILNIASNDITLLENLLNSLANRVLQLNMTTELLSYSSIQQKIAFSLLNLMTNYKTNNIITLPYSKKTWAECLNISRPSLFRELKNLSIKNILLINNRNISILDNKYLHELLNN